MCIAPITVYLGRKGELRSQQVACHECWQCRENAINDWVGRNIAETKTSIAAHAVTLTYGRDNAGSVDNIRAALLTYSDVQKYLKLLRRHGLPVRYFVTGEFGSEKGRAHWHIMLYWQRPLSRELLVKWFPGGDAGRNDPVTKRWVWRSWEAGDIPLDWNFNDDLHWPHGYSFWTRPTAHAVRYNCKYIQKDMGDAERQGHLAMSKKPPLGAVYFDMLAYRFAEQGIAPQGAGPHDEWEHGSLRIGGFEYSFPEVKRRNQFGRHEIVRFRLRDRSLELFLAAFVRHWRELHGDTPMPPSPLVEEFVEPGTWRDLPTTSKPLLVPIPKGQAPKPPMDFLDWRADFDKRNGNGTEQQQSVERGLREHEDQQRWQRFFD